MFLKNVNVPYIQTSQDMIFKFNLFFFIADILHNYALEIILLQYTINC